MMQGEPAIIEYLLGSVACLCWCIVVLYLMKDKDGER